MEPAKTDVPASVFTIVNNTWGDKKFKLKNRFSQLTDDDLDLMPGKESELIARLQARLNKSEAEVHELINKL